MATENIAVFGASGMLGARLCESLYSDKRYNFKALINSPGNAYRIARYPMHIEKVDLLDRRAVHRALAGCSVVVNCSRGNDPVMLRGFSNMLKSAAGQKVRKVIHISSVLIYGEEPSEHSTTEACPPNPGKNEYGIQKLKQDMMLMKYRDAFESVILCPPNIHGPYSPFSLIVAKALKAGQIVLVNGGENPCNVVHVDNLVAAIYRAIQTAGVKGERFFVTDSGDPTWKDYLTAFARILGLNISLTSIDECELEGGKTAAMRRTFPNPLRFIADSDFRNLLSALPLFGRLNNYLSYQFNCLSPRLQAFVRSRLSSPQSFPKEPAGHNHSAFLINMQTRKVRHSIEKAKAVLKYEPVMNYVDGLENTKKWLEFYGLA